MKEFLEALRFASIHHRGQRRKGPDGAPYINHLIEVADILAGHGMEDEELLSAAVLHDVVEDANIAPEDLRQRFGARVTGIVLEVTDNPNLPIWERKLAQIHGASQLSVDAQCVRVADKISNLRGVLTSPPIEWSLERKLAYFGWAEQVVVGCGLAPRRLVESFRAVHEAGLTTLRVEAQQREMKRRTSA